MGQDRPLLRQFLIAVSIGALLGLALMALGDSTATDAIRGQLAP